MINKNYSLIFFTILLFYSFSSFCCYTEYRPEIKKLSSPDQKMGCGWKKAKRPKFLISNIYNQQILTSFTSSWQKENHLILTHLLSGTREFLKLPSDVIEEVPSAIQMIDSNRIIIAYKNHIKFFEIPYVASSCFPFSLFSSQQEKDKLSLVQMRELSLETGDSIQAIRLCDNYLVALSHKGYLFTLKEYETQTSINLNMPDITTAIIMSSGLIYAGTKDGKIIMIDASNSKERKEINVFNNMSIASLQYSINEDLISIIAENQTEYALYNVKTGKLSKHTHTKEIINVLPAMNYQSNTSKSIVIHK